MLRISTVCAVKEREVGGRDYTFYYNFSSKSKSCHLLLSLPPSLHLFQDELLSVCVCVCVCARG